MKTKIKRHSRSVISVLLAVCMLVSCMTAGMIMTDAAKVNSESVGYSGGVNIGTSSTNSNNPYYSLNNNSCEFVVENDNTTIYWGFWVEDSNFWNTDDPDPDGSDGNIYYAKSDGNGCISKTLNAGRYKLTVTDVWKNDHGSNNEHHTLGYKLEKQPDKYYIHWGTNDNFSGYSNHVELTQDANDPTKYEATYSVTGNCFLVINNSSSSGETSLLNSSTTVNKLGEGLDSTWWCNNIMSQGTTYLVKFGTKDNRTGTVSVVYDTDGNTVDVNMDAGALPEGDWYIYGTEFGGWSGWSDSSPTQIKHMTKVSDTEWTYSFSIENDEDVEFRIWNDTDNKHYGSGVNKTAIKMGAAAVTAIETASNSYWMCTDAATNTSIPKNTPVVVHWNPTTKEVWIDSGVKSTLSIASDIAGATVTATYNDNTINEGGSLANVPAGAQVTINVKPDIPGKTCTAITTNNNAATSGSGKTWTLTMPAENTTITGVAIGEAATKRVYFNNFNTKYAMVSANARYANGTTISTQTMTKLDNTNIWYIELPEDVDYITFIGDNGSNTNDTAKYPSNPNGMMTIPWSNGDPMYTAPYNHNNAPTETNGGTWGKYTKRNNEIIVSDGETFTAPANIDKLFTGIKATFYDYYVDGEVDNGWLQIGNKEYSKADGSQYNWNPYTKLNSALSEYAATYGVSNPLYFGNLNLKSEDAGQLVIDKLNVGDSTVIKAYTGWAGTTLANNSMYLSHDNDAVTGLTGKTLAGSNIHYYKNGAANENGAVMAMFDEDFLSGQNTQNKELAQILRSTAFPVRKDEIKTYTHVYYDMTNNSSIAEGGGRKVYAYFWKGKSNIKVEGTKTGNVYAFAIPSGYEDGSVLFYSSTSKVGAWTYKTVDLTVPKNGNDKVKYTASNGSGMGGNWETYAQAKCKSHTYYEYNSQDGTDNAYITDIVKGTDGNPGTAKINYYTDKKVKSSGMIKDGQTVGDDYGFFPFDYNSLNNNLNDVAHDLGFGMKLEIPFTLEKNGIFSDGTPQEFRFSGDDDLWVFVDNQLVLDLGGAHKKTEGSINFAAKTVTANDKQALGSAARNGKFDWFDNSNPNQPHTMTIYYMERGMYDSNLKFGFSFHAIPNQFKSEKKVRTYNINSGFYHNNNQEGTASNQSDSLTEREGRFISKFEETYQNESFIVEQSYSTTETGSYTLAEDKKYTIGSTDHTVASDGRYAIQNDQIAYFLDEFTTGDWLKVKEVPNTNNQYLYDQSVHVYDDANNGAVVTGNGNADSGYVFQFKPTVNVAEGGLKNTNIRARFTNQMKSSDLTITKQVTGVTGDETEFTLRILFKFGSFGYISYPLECTVGGKSAVLGNDGTISITNGQSIVIEDIPVNAKVQIQEIDINQQYNYNGTTVTGADATNITNGTQFDMGQTAVNVTVNNNRFSGFTISKELKYSPETNVYVEYPDNDSQFRIKIETSSDGSNYAPYAQKAYTSSATTGTLTTDRDGIAPIKRGEKLSFNDLTANTYVRVTEDTQSSTYSGDDYSTHDHMPLDYQLKDITAVKGGTEEEAPGYAVYKEEGNYYHGCTFQLASVNRVDVTVTNMKPRYRWIAKYKHQTRSVDIANPKTTKHSIWGDVWYHSEGAFSAEELMEYTKFAIITPNNGVPAGTKVKGIEFKDSDAKASFLYSKTPYQDNFKETIEYNLKDAEIGYFYSEESGSQISLTPSEVMTNKETVDIKYILPCQMKLEKRDNVDQWIVNESYLENGVPKAQFTSDGLPAVESIYRYEYSKKSAYADWYCVNDATVSSGRTPAFIWTPEKVYDVDAGKYKYFKYWSVRTMTNNSSESVEYTRCYNNEYNYVFYQDSIVYAVYGEGEENKYDVARATESSANLTFLENSRNQWNIQASGNQIVSDFNGANNVKHGDRLFSDFVIDFHYVKDGKNLLLNEITDKQNYKTGLLIETVRELTSAEVDTVNKKMLKTDKQIAESFKASENIEAKSNALTFLSGDNTNASKYINSKIDIGKFDNKNELEYAYSFANISQSMEYRNRTERKMKVYRAYAYLINTGAGTDTSGQPADVQIISEPVYFTIYDMASIENDYDIAVTKN